MKRTLLVVSLCVFLSISCSASLVMRMTADDVSINVGDSTLVHIFAEVDDGAASGGNGLVLWDLAINADVAGVLDITNHTFVAPGDIFDNDFSSAGGSGSGWVMKDDDTTSTVGDGLTEIFNFEVTAVAVGVVTYDLIGLGDLVDYTAYDVVFDVHNSSNIITVHAPEPASLTLFALMSGFVLRRRR